MLILEFSVLLKININLLQAIFLYSYTRNSERIEYYTMTENSNNMKKKKNAHEQNIENYAKHCGFDHPSENVWRITPWPSEWTKCSVYRVYSLIAFISLSLSLFLLLHELIQMRVTQLFNINNVNARKVVFRVKLIMTKYTSCGDGRLSLNHRPEWKHEMQMITKQCSTKQR